MLLRTATLVLAAMLGWTEAHAQPAARPGTLKWNGLTPGLGIADAAERLQALPATLVGDGVAERLRRELRLVATGLDPAVATNAEFTLTSAGCEQPPRVIQRSVLPTAFLADCLRLYLSFSPVRQEDALALRLDGFRLDSLRVEVRLQAPALNCEAVTARFARAWGLSQEAEASARSVLQGAAPWALAVRDGDRMAEFVCRAAGWRVAITDAGLGVQGMRAAEEAREARREARGQSLEPLLGLLE